MNTKMFLAFRPDQVIRYHSSLMATCNWELFNTGIITQDGETIQVHELQGIIVLGKVTAEV